MAEMHGRKALVACICLLAAAASTAAQDFVDDGKDPPPELRGIWVGFFEPTEGGLELGNPYMCGNIITRSPGFASFLTGAVDEDKIDSCLDTSSLNFELANFSTNTHFIIKGLGFECMEGGELEAMRQFLAGGPLSRQPDIVEPVVSCARAKRIDDENGPMMMMVAGYPNVSSMNPQQTSEVICPNSIDDRNSRRVVGTFTLRAVVPDEMVTDPKDFRCK